jgi:hypothetical protein
MQTVSPRMKQLLLLLQNSIPRMSSRACAQCDNTGVQMIMRESNLVSLIPEHDAAVLERWVGEPILLVDTLDRQSGKAHICICLNFRSKLRKVTIKMYHITKMGVYISEASECSYLRSPLKGTSTLLPVNLASTASLARQNRQFCSISKEFSRPTTSHCQSKRKVERARARERRGTAGISKAAYSVLRLPWLFQANHCGCASLR